MSTLSEPRFEFDIEFRIRVRLVIEYYLLGEKIPLFFCIRFNFCC